MSKITIDGFSWKDYFLNEKRNVLSKLNWTDEQIIAKYEQDLKEHKESYSSWNSHGMGAKKLLVIRGLEEAIEHMRNFPDGEQLRLDN
jgi:hypothetical protein